MKKICIALLLCTGILAGVCQANCADMSAEQHVKDFYTWYITEQKQQVGLLDDPRLKNYVEPCVVQNLRIFYLRSYFDTEYFTKSQDSGEEWLDVLVVHPATIINDTTSIVPISFTFTPNKQHHLVVFVQHINTTYRITKVVGTAYATE